MMSSRLSIVTAGWSLPPSPISTTTSTRRSCGGNRVPQPPPRYQRERLERLVWPYEPTLSLDEVRLAVRIGLLDAVQAGTMAIADHHASAGCLDSARF
jgi:hypothetical protein